MRLRSAAVVGGGPGGLYAARLIKLSQPDCRVDVYEDADPARTFGFGVGLATRTQRNLQAADPDTLRDILETSWPHDMSMRVAGRKVQLPGDNLIAIGRTALLDLLRRHAAAVGVRLHYGARVRAEDLDADVVIAADGVSSGTREAHAREFGADIEWHDSLYVWCGTEFALPSAVFTPARTEHGTFVAHAYPYAADRSTFLVEVDETTWRAAGFDRTTELTAVDDSDETTLAYLGDAFAEELRGHRLIGNRTRWLRFRTVRCRQWHHGNLVLLGDAAHTAHYSIGSGTKLAMEGAIALSRALAEQPTVAEALAEYDAVHRPGVEHLQETADRSMHWWDSFATRLDLPVERLFVSYMTRAGKVSIDKFATRTPHVVDAALAQFADVAAADVDTSARVDWVLSRPLTLASGQVPGRVVAETALTELVGAVVRLEVDVAEPWGARADGLVARTADAVRAAGAHAVLLSCADDVGATLTMFDIGERMKRETGALVVARLDPKWRDLAADALVSGRTDLVTWASEQEPVP
ncbi:FAD-dependent monooxygenase [Kineosporia sp. R_H_3]|uniref:FAD-dependent monooxygenase n=1 Tax=Kineosporia sp. R_H_3 TaxID=1961848 RepID=UPI000B4B3B89|nr:FAD-dependent monooxygenase [Kineosporia sp. R_H_3]